VKSASITVVGLGPGPWDDLTLAAHEILKTAPVVVFRTTRHPTVDELRKRRPDLVVESFDALYDGARNFATLYADMAERLFARAAGDAGARQGNGVNDTDGDANSDLDIVYAVPGHPLIGEDSVKRLLELAGERDVPIRIVAGLSFLEPVCAALGLDPVARGVQVLDATQLAVLDPAAVMGAILPTEPALISQLYNRRVASAVKIALSAVYPDDWHVTVVRAAGLPNEAVERIALFELDRGERADHLTTLYVPPLNPLDAQRVPEGLRNVVERLRAPEGCPWDREQTHMSLRPFVLEEAYEVAEILDEWEGTPEQAEHLAEELGDLLLQVYLQAEIGRGEGLFDLGDVFAAVSSKLIRRHPHVFGEVQVSDSAHVLRNWEAIKRAERVAQGDDVSAESVLRGIPRSAPALYQAHELSRKAAKVGFDWPGADEALAKVREEIDEVEAARSEGDSAQLIAEVGDLLFATGAYARRLGVQPEEALRLANARFRRRFEAMEARARTDGRDLGLLTPDEWLAWWRGGKVATSTRDGRGEGA
jgi:tetrapyrrole methylase family protein/MazG family protein